jgi:multidrug efflux pump subunit AcrB
LSCGCAPKTASSIMDVDDVLISDAGGQVVQAKNLVRVVPTRPGPVQIARKNQERITRVNAELEPR